MTNLLIRKVPNAKVPTRSVLNTDPSCNYNTPQVNYAL